MTLIPVPFRASFRVQIQPFAVLCKRPTYVRDDTLTAANAKLLSSQNRIGLAHVWSGGEVASADAMRFVVAIRTVHAGPSPKYFGQLKIFPSFACRRAARRSENFEFTF